MTVAAQSAGPALARAVRDLLPPDARIVVCWRDAGGDAYSADDAAPAALVARALSMLGTKGRARDAEILDHWTTEHGTQIVLAAQSASGVVTPLRDAWQAMARRAVSATLEAMSGVIARAHSPTSAL